MRGAVSPLRVTLILTVPHLHLKRAGIRSLSSRTGNTSTYIPASSTLLILLWCLRFSRYIYTMICVAALCRTSSSPLLKLNTAMTYKIGTKALSAILDAMKLIRSPPVDSCSEYDPNDSCSKLPHIERQHGIAFLWALWFIRSGQPTLYAMKRNLKNMLPLLFFNMFLFCYSVFSTYSMFLVRKGSRDICSQQLIELACTWSIGFQLLAAIQHRIFKPVPLSRFIYRGYGVPLLCTLWSA